MAAFQQHLETLGVGDTTRTAVDHAVCTQFDDILELGIAADDVLQGSTDLQGARRVTTRSGVYASVAHQATL